MEINTKELLIDAICGTYPPSYSSVIQHLVEYTGDQWNESWEWKREELEKLSTEYLEELYNLLKDKGSKVYKQDLIITLEATDGKWSRLTAEQVLEDLFKIVRGV